MPEIEIRSFSARRGDFNLGPIDLTIRSGEIFSILGRTGSGKSVMVEALSGMFPGLGGSILYDGVDISSAPLGSVKIGYLPQEHCLFPHMTVDENIGYGLKMHKEPKLEIREKVGSLMKMLSIEHLHGRYPGTLSGGESQRVALARALALEPGVLLMDEPFNALDPATKEGLYREIERINRSYGCSIVFVTHDFEEAMRLSDRIGILLSGKLHAVVESKHLLDERYDEEVENFLGRRELWNSTKN